MGSRKDRGRIAFESQNGDILTGNLLPKAASVHNAEFWESGPMVAEYARKLREINPEEFARILEEIRRRVYVLCGKQGAEEIPKEAKALAEQEQVEIDKLINPIEQETTEDFKIRTTKWRSFLAIRALVQSAATQGARKTYLGRANAKFRTSPTPERVPDMCIGTNGRIKKTIEPTTPLDELADIIAYTDDLETSPQDDPKVRRTLRTLRAAAHAELIQKLISTNTHFIEIGSKFLTYEHYLAILQSSHGALSEGRIGGKSAGMLIAYAALEHEDPKFDEEFAKKYNISPQELRAMVKEALAQNQSTFIGSVVFHEIINNNPKLAELTTLKHDCKDPEMTLEELSERYREARENVLAAEVPKHLEIQLKRLFEEKFKGHPCVIRSSAELEDLPGTAFAGKYESVYVSGESFEEFITGIKIVYASVFNPNVMMYRKNHNLLNETEEMGILIQVMNGEQHGDYFYPTFAGVDLSLAVQSTGPDPEEGAMCLVTGLGETAVGEGGRVILFAKPQDNPHFGKPRPAQKKIIVMNTKTGKKEEVTISDLIENGNAFNKDAIRYIVSRREHGGFSEFATSTIETSDNPVITFNQLVKGGWKRDGAQALPMLMHYMVKKLEHELGHRVDVEFTADPYQEGTGFDSKIKYKINIVQCRPQNIPEGMEPSSIPESIPEKRVIFKSTENLSSGHAQNIRYMLHVDPSVYAGRGDPEAQDQLNAEEIKTLARYIDQINAKMGEKDYLVLAPGRWGSNPESVQGIPVQYSHFHNAAGFIEMRGQGWDAEPSFGTHFFQDVVEAGQKTSTVSLDPKDQVQGNSFINNELISSSENVIDSLGIDIPPKFKKWLKLIDIEKEGTRINGKKAEWRLHMAQDNRTSKNGKKQPRMAAAYIGEKDHDLPEQ